MLDYVKRMRSLIGHEPLLMPAAGIIIYKDGQILLQKRTDNGNWGLHGGALNLGETMEEAARRELYEETGLEALSLDLYGMFSGEDMHCFYPNGDEAYYVCVEYFCGSFKGEVKLDPEEVTEVKWFSVDSLPENLNKPVDSKILSGLKEYLSGRGLI